MNCAPRLDMARRSFSPAWSTEVTSLRSTTHVQTLRLRYAFLQFVLSSLTHGSTKRPCRTQRISAGVLVTMIFSTFPLFGPRSEETAWRYWKHDGERCLQNADGPLVGDSRTPRGLKNCNACAKVRRFSEIPNSLIYIWIAEERVRQITVPACRCQSNGKAAISRGTREVITDRVAHIYGVRQMLQPFLHRIDGGECFGRLSAPRFRRMQS
jgi:hypothetical protein